MTKAGYAALTFLALIGLSHGAAGAFPDGAPWALDPERGCSACHFTAAILEPPFASMVKIGRPEPGALDLAIDASALGGDITGFLLRLEGAGEVSTETPELEAMADMLRSTTPRADGRWSFRLRHARAADHANKDDMRLILWLNAADGDGSPFGDRITRVEGRIATDAGGEGHGEDVR
ncbi:MAG: hypothetical protein Tsb008_22330 [Rhodothalassiaceae bacterium]